MSVTIKGDTTQLLGEHLPTPYIDRIVMKGVDAAAQMDIHLSIHVPHNETKYFAHAANTSATLLTQDIAYRPYISALQGFLNAPRIGPRSAGNTATPRKNQMPPCFCLKLTSRVSLPPKFILKTATKYGSIPS